LGQTRSAAGGPGGQERAVLHERWGLGAIVLVAPWCLGGGPVFDEIARPALSMGLGGG
jgi:hypothetical protein